MPGQQKHKKQTTFLRQAEQTTIEIDLWGLISKKKREEQEQYYVIC